MKKLILIAGVILSSTVLNAQDTVKGIEVENRTIGWRHQSNLWNKDVFKKSYFYTNRSWEEDNYPLYQEAEKVLIANGFEFDNPTDDSSVLEEEFDVHYIIYEKDPYGSDLYIHRVYHRNNIVIVVHISETMSYISVDQYKYEVELVQN